jgi:hypothetical protein
MAKAKRKKNPKRPMPPALKLYWQARNKRLRNPKGRKRRVRRNPLATQHVLFAQRRGGKVLKYVGGVKFSQSGHAVRFPSRPAALQVGRELKRQFNVLKPFKIWAT